MKKKILCMVISSLCFSTYASSEFGNNMIIGNSDRNIIKGVVDGYNIDTANVFLDENGNGVMDSNEPFGKMDKDGEFEIKLNDVKPIQNKDYSQIVANISKDNKIQYQLYSSPISLSFNGNVILNPVTTLAWKELKIDFFKSHINSSSSKNFSADYISVKSIQNDVFSFDYKGKIKKIAKHFNIPKEEFYQKETSSNKNKKTHYLYMTLTKGLIKSYSDEQNYVLKDNDVSIINYAYTGTRWAKETLIIGNYAIKDSWALSHISLYKKEIIDKDMQRIVKTISLNDNIEYGLKEGETTTIVSEQKTINKNNKINIDKYKSTVSDGIVSHEYIINNKDTSYGIHTKDIINKTIDNRNKTLTKSNFNVVKQHMDETYPINDELRNFIEKRQDIDIKEINRSIRMTQDFPLKNYNKGYVFFEKFHKDANLLTDKAIPYAAKEIIFIKLIRGKTSFEKTVFKNNEVNVYCKNNNGDKWGTCNIEEQ